MSPRIIPMHKPHIGHDDEEMVLNAMKKGDLSGDGFYGKLLKGELKNILGVSCALPTPSCTGALELSLMALGVGPGDEVIMPSFAFVSAATAILRQGAKPVFVDIDELTYNLDTARLEQAITQKTKAVIVVHYAGGSCDMDRLTEIARKHNVKIIEDAAHAIGAKYKNKFLGTIGDAGCFSFHGTKNLAIGEGGAFVTNDAEMAARAEIIREKGTNRSAFFKGEVAKYEWVGEGSSFLLADILSAMLISQLKKIAEINQKRKEIAEFYLKNLASVGQKIILPKVLPGVESSWHIFSILVQSEKRVAFIDFLKNKGIMAAFHFVPLHLSPMGRAAGSFSGDMRVTEKVSASLVRLPIYPGLTEEEKKYIVEVVIMTTNTIL